MHADRPAAAATGSGPATGVQGLLDRPATSERPAGPERGAAQRRPILDLPWPVLAILAALVGIHAARLLIPEAWDDALFARLAFVPGRLTYAVAPDPVIDAVVDLARRGAEGYRRARVEMVGLGDGSPQPWTLVAYALLHNDWGHLAVNGAWLLVFGTPAARRLGAWRFSALLLLAAAAGAAAQWASHPLDLFPLTGASASAAGCVGAVARLMVGPGAAFGLSGAFGRPGMCEPVGPLRGLVRDRGAVAFLAVWFAADLLSALGPASFGIAGGAGEWQAHAGGLLAGLLLFPWLDPVRRVDPAVLAPLAPVDPMAGL